MYRVNLLNINNNTSYTIHNSNISKTKSKVTNGSIVKGINSIGSFSFTILKSNPAFDYVYPYTSLIQVYNQKKDRYDFKGRILKIKPNMSSNGLVSKTIICEDRLGYLQDSIQPYLEEKYWEGDSDRNGLEEFIDYILDNHNSQVDDYKKIYRGKVTVKPFESSNNISKGLNYESTWEIISKKLIDSFGGEIQLIEKDNKLYLDYLEEIGEEKKTSIVLKKNMQSIAREIDPTTFITRLIPLGAKLKKKTIDTSGNVTETETGERLTIASVNNGSIFLDSPEINSLGVLVKTVEYNDVTDANNLLSKAKQFLEENNKLLNKTTIKALDLSLINKDIDDFEVGNYYPISNKLVDLDEKLRVIKKTINILEPLSSSFDLGDSKKLLSSLTIEQSKSNNDAIQEIKKDYVPNIKLIEEITKLSSLISQTSQKILLEVAENYTQNSDYKATSKRLADLVLKVDSINQTVSSWGDLTSTIEGDNELLLKNAMEGELIYLSIRGEINLLYPDDNLYPSDDLYPIDPTITIEKDDGTKNSILIPFSSLHYLDKDTYDEFIIEKGITYLVKRVGIDEEGNFYKLSEVISQKIGSIEVILSKGLNKIYLSSFANAHLLAKYVVQNPLTDIYATTIQLKSSITQLADSINLVVEKKVDSNKIISTINQTAEEIKIAAEKLNFNGKEFNLTSDNMTINSDNFNVDKDGNMTCNNANAKNLKIVGGEIVLNDKEFSQASFRIKSDVEDRSAFLASWLLSMQASEKTAVEVGQFYNAGSETEHSGIINLFGKESGLYLFPKFRDEEGVVSTISLNGSNGKIVCVSLTQKSLKESKKNFEKYENALKELDNIDIYKYHFKGEKDSDKKHLGFVIGEGFKYSETITSNDNQGVENYSFTSLCFQMIKEQQSEIKELQNELKELKERI